MPPKKRKKKREPVLSQTARAQMRGEPRRVEAPGLKPKSAAAKKVEAVGKKIAAKRKEVREGARSAARKVVRKVAKSIQRANEKATTIVGGPIAENIVLPIVSRAKTAVRIGKLLKGGPPKTEELIRRRKKATRAAAARAKKKKEAAVRTISMKDVDKLPLRGGQTEPPKKKKKRTHNTHKVEKVLGEFKRGTLQSSSGAKVTSRKQAVAIGLSEARQAGEKVAPRPKKKKRKK